MAIGNKLFSFSSIKIASTDVAEQVLRIATLNDPFCNDCDGVQARPNGDYIITHT